MAVCKVILGWLAFFSGLLDHCSEVPPYLCCLHREKGFGIPAQRSTWTAHCFLKYEYYSNKALRLGTENADQPEIWHKQWFGRYVAWHATPQPVLACGYWKLFPSTSHSRDLSQGYLGIGLLRIFFWKSITVHILTATCYWLSVTYHSVNTVSHAQSQNKCHF